MGFLGTAVLFLVMWVIIGHPAEMAISRLKKLMGDPPHPFPLTQQEKDGLTTIRATAEYRLLRGLEIILVGPFMALCLLAILTGGTFGHSDRSSDLAC
jgi:hypothetical protein